MLQDQDLRDQSTALVLLVLVGSRLQGSRHGSSLIYFLKRCCLLSLQLTVQQIQFSYCSSIAIVGHIRVSHVAPQPAQPLMNHHKFARLRNCAGNCLDFLVTVHSLNETRMKDVETGCSRLHVSIHGQSAFGCHRYVRLLCELCHNLDD